MGGVLVVYASTHGHIEKIAGRIGDAIRQEGVEADVRDVKDAADADPADYDGVIVAASLHGASHQRETADCVAANGASLASLPTAFVSVSLTAAEDTEEAREAAQRCIDDFLKQTDWAPGQTIPIAGALQYREHDVYTRTLMRR
jgi:menaquinone-dependent protoporphyrinogen oxidase